MNISHAYNVLYKSRWGLICIVRTPESCITAYKQWYKQKKHSITDAKSMKKWENNMTEERRLYLTKSWIKGLFVYYFLIFIVGIVLSILALIPSIINLADTSIIIIAILGSVGMALVGASIFYIRKLYKLCFKEYVDVKNEDNSSLKRIGTIVYFIGRPLFGVGFSILVIIGLQSGFMLTSNKPLDLNIGFIYVTMFSSFFVGFLSGKFVKKLEGVGEKVINKVSG